MQILQKNYLKFSVINMLKAFYLLILPGFSGQSVNLNSCYRSTVAIPVQRFGTSELSNNRFLPSGPYDMLLYSSFLSATFSALQDELSTSVQVELPLLSSRSILPIELLSIRTSGR